MVAPATSFSPFKRKLRGSAVLVEVEYKVKFVAGSCTSNLNLVVDKAKEERDVFSFARPPPGGPTGVDNTISCLVRKQREVVLATTLRLEVVLSSKTKWKLEIVDEFSVEDAFRLVNWGCHGLIFGGDTTVPRSSCSDS